MNITALILDVCFAVSVCWMVYKSYRRGFLQAAVHAVGFLAAGIVAFAGSRILSEACYQLFFRDSLSSALETAILSSAESGDLAEKIQLIIDSLPSMVQRLLTASGASADSLALQLGGAAQDSAVQLSSVLMESVLHPLIVTMLNGICFLILFGAVMILVRSLGKILRGVRRIPLVGPLNALLGGAMGLVEAAVIWYVIVIAIHFVLDISGGFSWLNRETMEDALIFGRFYSFMLNTLPTISL